MGVLDELVREARRRARALPDPGPVRCDRPSFAAALRGRQQLSVIAEFKRGSPSAGRIAADASIADQVFRYREAGAVALSVLTEPTAFGGRDRDLTEAAALVDLPLLMKDFVVDPRQVDHAAALGASAVLLIARCLDDAALEELAAVAGSRSLDVLIECHDEGEIDRALGIPRAVIGVNNRDLDRLVVDRQRALQLLPRIPADRIAVAESGYQEPGQLRALRGLCDAVLIGTALMRARDPGEFVREGCR